MKTWPRRLAFLFLTVVLLASSAPLPAPTQASQDGPHLMPPHPLLLKEYKAGRMPTPDFILNPDLWHAKGIDSPAEPTSLLGSLNALAVVVDFSDKFKTVTASYFDTMIFAAPVVGRGSVYDYFDEVSYGQIDIVTVNAPSSMGWIRAPSSYVTYVNGGYCTNGAYPNNCQKLAEDIVDAVNGVVNFDLYDNDNDGIAEPIMLIHAGRGAEYTGSVNDVWSHSWSLEYPRTYDGVTIADYVIMPEYWTSVSAGTSDMTIGVFAHEMGHGFWGLPDLYDRDGSSEGVGDWSLMAGGSWNGGTTAGGDSPAWPDAWSRVQMGILTATNISSNVAGRSIPQALNNPSPAQTVLKLDSAALGPQEYFLLENRQQVSGSYDQYLPGAGLFVWHVDEAMWSYSLQNDDECTTQPNHTCSDTNHYLVRLAQADGALDLENGYDRGDAGDPFPGTAVNRNFGMATDPESSSYYSSAPSCIGVTNISNSLATMTADLQVSCGAYKVYLPLVLRSYIPPGPPPTAPAWLSATPISETQINLTWSDLSSDETDFHIDRSPNGSSGWTEIGTSPANTPAYSSISLSCGTPYYYRVRAHRAIDNQYSAYSNTANATTTACVGWTTISSVDFEGSFPGDWTVFDNDGVSHGEYFWGKRTCRPGAGSYSGWGVGGGANGSALSCGVNYPNYADGWMMYGPFSLVGATAADLSYNLWANLESGYDYVCRMASTNGLDFSGYCTTGTTAGYIPRTLDLSAVPTLGNLLGQPNVWVAITFDSDLSVTKSEGGYVDNIVLRKCMTGSCGASPPANDIPSGAAFREEQRMRTANR